MLQKHKLNMTLIPESRKRVRCLEQYFLSHGEGLHCIIIRIIIKPGIELTIYRLLYGTVYKCWKLSLKEVVRPVC